MEKEALRNTVEALLRTEKFGVLATSGEEGPYTSLLSFVVSDDLRSIIFATSSMTGKFRNLMSSPSVSFLVDNRGARGGEIMEIETLSAIGEAYVLTDKQSSFLKGRLLQKFPDLGSFLADPETAIVEVKVKKYIMVSRFQEAAVLGM